MNKIKIAYIAEITHIVLIISMFFYSFVNPDVAEMILRFVMIIVFGISINMIWRDAKERKMPIYHGLWALLGIFGLLIYHLLFVKQNGNKKKKGNRSKIKNNGKITLILGVIALVFTILFFPLGLILALISIIIGFFQLKEEKTNNGIIGVVLGGISTALSLLIIFLIFLGVSSIINVDAELESKSVEESIEFCNSKSPMGYLPCNQVLLNMFEEEELVKSGAFCNNIGDLGDLCIYNGLDHFRSNYFCNGLNSSLDKDFCMASMSMDKKKCSTLDNGVRADLCVKLINRINTFELIKSNVNSIAK